ncbi:MAG: RNA polymerase factor sigma-54 [Arcicella sp.]|nr:RNA polymerase factor sigma-54 [Arcicella sp.]
MFKLSQSQKQTLKISPAQIQLLNFLQMNTMELEQHLKNELEENPLLEEGVEESEKNDDGTGDSNDFTDGLDSTQDFMDWDEFGNDDTPDYRTRVNNISNDDNEYTPIISQLVSWREELKEQFLMLSLSERQQFVAGYVVDSLTDEGYLPFSVIDIADDISFSNGMFIEPTEVEEILKIMSCMKPVGLGSRDLQDCMIRQLLNCESKNQEKVEQKNMAICIVENHFEDLSKRNYERIMRTASINQEQLKNVIQLIGTLNPKPVMGGNNDTLQIKDNVVPDYIVNVEGETIEVELNNRQIPPIKINKFYVNMMGDSRAANSYVNNKLNSANWLIDAIIQRENTMTKVMQTIVKMQANFFKRGDERLLKPMILKDVAERISMDISTVSRVTSGKYAQTPFGTIHLKDLFTEGLMSDSGEEVSNRKIQLALEELIKQEDKRNPLNDFQLMDLLSAQGLNVARRTVAKYRDLMNIPSIQMRRIL